MGKNMKMFNLLEHVRGNSIDSVVIWIFNIDVEKQWNDSISLVKDNREDIVVNHIEEIAFLLAKEQDYVILRKQPSEFFLHMLSKKNFFIPHILCPEKEDEDKGISELILEDKSLLKVLSLLAKDRVVHFVPYGVSQQEEKIARLCNLNLVGGTSIEKKIINNKIFSRKTAQNLNYKMAEGIICHSVEEIEHAYNKLIKKSKHIVIKMACNSSGRGMWIIENESEFKTAYLIIKRYLLKNPNIPWILEEWLEKRVDLNFQIYVSERGYVETFSVKEQILHGTVYVGSYLPPRISKGQYLQCLRCGEEIGQFLFRKGYTGVFGVDALITKQNVLIPIIEINGRFTLSSYISFLEMRYPDKIIYSFYKKVHLNDQFSYQRMILELSSKGILLDETGIFVYVSATADVKLAKGNCRLFCMVIAETDDRIKELCNEFDSLCSKYTIITSRNLNECDSN